MADKPLAPATRARLANRLLEEFAETLDPAERKALRARLHDWIEAAHAELSAEHRAGALAYARPTTHEKALARASPVSDEWLDALAKVVARAWFRQKLLDARLPPASEQRLEEHLGKYPVGALKTLLGAAIRETVGRPRPEDDKTLRTWFATFSKETAMSTPDFYIDGSNIPALQSDANKQLYLKAIQDALTDSFGMSAAEADPLHSARAAAIVGFVLLDEEYDTGSLSFFESLKRAWIEALGKTKAYPSGEVPNQKVYEFVAQAIVDLNGGKAEVSYQELAAVSRHVIQGADSFPFDHPNFIASVRIGVDAFVSGIPTGESLSLPPGSLPGTSDDAGADGELNGANISAVGTIYAIALLEKTFLFKAVEQMCHHDYMHGLLPIGYDGAGKLLDAYYWDAKDRYSEAERASHYARILGMPGGEVSKAVKPNREFESLFMRFIASVAEYDRQRRVADILDTRRRSVSLSGEQVRTAANSLAKNVSLYGWASTHFIARRLNAQLSRAIEIVKHPQIQKAFGVTNPWQVVERIAMNEFGVTPNITKFRTMAEASKSVFDLLARKTREMATASSSRPFLYEYDTAAGDYGRGDLTQQETQELLRNVQQWLAVNGVADDQVLKYSQPVETVSTPSLPPMGGGSDSDMVEKLRKMVASGSTPSLDQLQQLLPGMR